MAEKKYTLIGVAIVLFTTLIAGVFFYLWFIKAGKAEPALSNAISKIPFIGARFSSRTAEEKIVLEEIEKERSMLQAEWDKINRQMDEINKKQEELKNKEIELKTKEEELNLAKAKMDESEKNMKNIAQYYELMETGRAARIIESMEDEFVIQIFRNMKKESVAEILANMDPKRAAAITKKLSGLQ
ncbi:MotE family protein [Thermosediminibacter litoriperuensis]|nr:magnesium transporter MgtE [Thermosediminibacter litoriperuensis]